MPCPDEDEERSKERWQRKRNGSIGNQGLPHYEKISKHLIQLMIQTRNSMQRKD